MMVSGSKQRRKATQKQAAHKQYSTLNISAYNFPCFGPCINLTIANSQPTPGVVCARAAGDQAACPEATQHSISSQAQHNAGRAATAAPHNAE
jgi:hypothetical protein